MNKPNSAALFGFFVALIVAICGVPLLKGGFYMNKFEGDTYHLMQIVFRMADGQWPHLDFMTPIGAMAFAPIALFVKAGFGIGTSFLLAQTLVAVVFLPAVWWAAKTRLNGSVAYFFGLIMLVMIGGLIHGGAGQGISVSMHYNRWAWAAAFLAIVMVFLPNSDRERPVIEGIIVGLCLAMLGMTKVTYFVTFAPVIAVGLLLHKSFRTAGVAIAVGFTVLLAVTLVAGTQFWWSYFRDVVGVAISDIRPKPGADMATLLGGPDFLGATITLLFAIILLRQSGKQVAGLLLLLLAPGFVFVTYQNFGNDPQWLLLLFILLLASLPDAGLKNGFGWDLRTALKIAAVASLAFAAPSFFNVAFSPFRHAGADPTKYTDMLPGSGIHEDIKTWAIRANRVDGSIALDTPESGLDQFREAADRGDPTVFMGETLPRCEVDIGIPAWLTAISNDLEQAGYADGRRVFAADVLSSHWLFGSFEPLENGAPWYYSGLPGFKSADFLLVPLCPLLQRARHTVLEAVSESEIQVEEVRRTPLYILYTVNK